MAKKNRSLFSRKRSGKSKYKSRKISSRRSNLGFENLEGRDLLAVAIFQEGLGTYTGTEDTVLFSQKPDSNFAAESAISVDQQDANGVRQGLLKFDNIIGNVAGQIPEGSIINSAELRVEITNPSTSQAQMSLYRMLEPWSESAATWNNPTIGGSGSIGGVQASEGEVTAFPPDFTLFDPRTTSVLGADAPNDDPDRVPGDPGTFDVTRSLQSWVSGEIDNNGWLIESTATDGWDFTTSEGGQAARPYLVVDFTAPSSQVDTIKFLETEVVQAEGNSGTTQLELTVARLGGTGAASVNFAVADGTAQDAGTPPGDNDYDPPVGNSISFGANEFIKTITIDINGDTVLEGNETLTVTLSGAVGATLDGTADVATVTIADDDALINEVLANVSVVDGGLSDEQEEYEYVELIGTPGASLNGYYFVVFEGQEEEGAAGSGVADVVVNLSGQSFGSDGLLVIADTDWAYFDAGNTGTTFVGINGFSLEDDSQTYALVKSSVAIIQGTDYDTVGAYVGTSRDTIDNPLGSVGVLDVAPFTPGGAAQIVDSVSVFNGGSDRDRAIVQEGLGLPGVHVHQPTRTVTDTNVASDAVSRLFGNTLPNTIGSWFNGDILDSEADDFGSGVIEYQNGTTKISAVAPDGSVLTPGTANILNNVFITADVESVNEPGSGTVNVTFTVTRTGDLSSGLTVDYQTLDGTATGGADFVAQPSGQVTFTGTGSSTQTETITVVVNSDSVAEGFEDFSVQLTSTAVPFLITDDTASVRINDGDVLLADFRQNAVGTQGGAAYTGTLDTYIDAQDTRTALSFGIDPQIKIDDAEGGDFDGGGEGLDIRPQQGLIKFDNMFGGATNQVPSGAQIFGGTLNLFVTGQSDSGATINFHRMLKDWDENATWDDPQGGAGSDLSGGVTPDSVGAYHEPDFSVPLPAAGGAVEVPLNLETIQGWSNGSLTNYGWVAFSDSGVLWQFDSSEGFTLVQRPQVSLQYTDPTGEAGLFAFGQQETGASSGAVTINEGGSIDVVVNRIGGTSGAANVDFSISFGSASTSDISATTPSTSLNGGVLEGTLSFPAGVLSQTISIPTFEDATAEIDETLTITLDSATAGGIFSDADSLELTIRDDDYQATIASSTPALVSEIVYNQPGNDGAAELFELVGTPNAPLGSFYAVVIAGDVGEDQGATDLVVNLGSFYLGSNGTLLIGAQTGFTWDVPAGTTFVGIPELDVEFLGGSDNGTSTYALIYSPTTPLFEGRFDYDVDNSGGTLALPADAVVVDAISIHDTPAGTPDDEDTSYTDASAAVGGNVIFQEVGSGDAIDGVSRTAGNTTRNAASAWYGGDLIGSDDALVYDWRDTTESFNLPQDGAAASPGLPNSAANPAITVNSVDYTSTGVSITFSGSVDQVLLGDGTNFNGDFGPGISVTDNLGVAIPGIDAIPSVTGIGTNTLELTFTGTDTINGNLPAGSYTVNIVGNSLVADGRAVDADLAGAINETSIALEADADFDNNDIVSGTDFMAWLRGFGTASGATNSDGDADADADVDDGDLGILLAQYGGSGTTVVAAATASEEPGVALDSGAWLSAPSSLSSKAGSDEIDLDEGFSDYTPTNYRSSYLQDVALAESETEENEVEEIEDDYDYDAVFASLGELS